MQMSRAIFAGGCFWCTQHAFDQIPGVVRTTVGFTAGSLDNPTYEEVCTGTTGHVEALLVEYDETRISYKKLLQIYWHSIDPTQSKGQFCDIGAQYRPVIFYTTKQQQAEAIASKKELLGQFQQIAVDILPAKPFYPASEKHQQYYKKNPESYQRYEEGSGRKQRLARLWKMSCSKKEWRAKLSDEQYRILREGGTEPPFDNAYFDHKEEGVYLCAGCGCPLFSSKTKYDSKTGWPSFYAPLAEENILIKNRGLSQEVLCAQCEGHLGHHFYDGPAPTKERYCINSAALTFVPNS